MCADVLAQRSAFAAFPRLEIPFREKLHRLDVPSGLVQQRAQLHAQVIALLHQLRKLFQFAPAFRRCFTEPFPKLVPFVEQARVGPIHAKCPVINRARPAGVLADVEVAKAKVAPDDGEICVQLRGLFPEADRLVMAAAVV